MAEDQSVIPLKLSNLTKYYGSQKGVERINLQVNRGLAIGVTILVFILSYLLNSFANLIDWLKPYQPLSIFKYYNAQDTLVHGVNYLYMAILFIVGFVFIPLSLYVFNRRDVGV